MQRLLLSLAVIVAVGGATVASTGAFFNDTETSTGNTFTAGAIDLKVDNHSYGFDWNRPGAINPIGIWGLNDFNTWLLSDLPATTTVNNQVVPKLFFNFADLKPGDFGEDTISLHVNSNDAYACMAFRTTATPENAVNGAEASVPDTTTGTNDGELQNYLRFAFWQDDGDNVYEQGETLLTPSGGVLASSFNGTWASTTQSILTGGQDYYVGKYWCFGQLTETPIQRSLGDNTPPTETTTGFNCSGAGDQNIAQTDGIGVNVAFYAVQSRHNSFSCSNLAPLGA